MTERPSVLNHPLGILPRFFASNANYQEINLTQSELILTTYDDRAKAISYMDISHDIKLTTGYFGGELIIESFDGSHIIVGGISKSEITTIQHILSQLISKLQKHYFSNLQPKIINAYGNPPEKQSKSKVEFSRML